MNKEIAKLIKEVKKCSQEVLAELGAGWQECVYQSAMEVSLRDKGIAYENQRILPITFNDHVIGESIPDLVIWSKGNGKKTALVVDLKADAGIKAEHGVQVERYIRELKKQVRKDEIVHPTGLLINFVKDATQKKLTEGFDDLDGVQVLEVKG